MGSAAPNLMIYYPLFAAVAGCLFTSGMLFQRVVTLERDAKKAAEIRDLVIELKTIVAGHNDNLASHARALESAQRQIANIMAGKGGAVVHLDAGQ